MTRHELGILLVRLDHARMAAESAWTLFDQGEGVRGIGRLAALEATVSPAFAAQRRAYENLAEGVREFLSTTGAK